jgi:hypothetical protein
MTEWKLDILRYPAGKVGSSVAGGLLTRTDIPVGPKAVLKTRGEVLSNNGKSGLDRSGTRACANRMKADCYDI